MGGNGRVGTGPEDMGERAWGKGRPASVGEFQAFSPSATPSLDPGVLAPRPLLPQDLGVLLSRTLVP